MSSAITMYPIEVNADKRLILPHFRWLSSLLFSLFLTMPMSGSDSVAQSQEAAPSQHGQSRVSVGGDLITEAIRGAESPLTLADCVQMALTANTELQAERENRDELKGQMIQARSTGLPTLDLTGTMTRGRDPSFALDESFSGGGELGDDASSLDSLFAGLDFLPAPEDVPTQTFWRASVNTHWELRPGIVLNAVRAAGVAIERQELAIAEVENRIIESVLMGYYSIIRAGEQVGALGADVAARSEFLGVTRRRFSLGLATPLDTLQAAVSHANMIPQRRSALQRLKDAGSRLNVLMGRPPLTALSILSDVPLELSLLDVDLAARCVERRLDVRQIELFEIMLRRNRGAQKAEVRPYLSADASYGYVAREPEDLREKGHDFWNASLTLTVPLFDGLSTKGRVKSTEAAIRRTRFQRVELLRQARLEVLSILGDLETARANHEAAALNLTAAEDAASQVTLRYDLGRSSYLDVLNGQAERFLARSNLITARNEVLTQTAALKRALGFTPMISLDEMTGILKKENGQSEPSPDKRRR